MQIQHNIMAMNAYRNYASNTSALSKNLEKLSSGYKINRAGDDAAGLAISEKMRAQITGLNTAQDNAKSGINLVQTAEGSMTEVHDMLNRMVELSDQSANGTYDNDTDRANLQKEVTQLKSEINRIADSSNFNGIKLLDGSLSGASQVSNVAMDSSTALKGIYTTQDFAQTSDLSGLTSDDIGKTMDYTVTWADSTGTQQTTKVSLTYKGDGTGSDNATAQNNYFVDGNGQKYNLASDGTLSLTQVQSAVMSGLKNDADFSSNFDVATSTNALAFTAKTAGSSTAQVISAGSSSNLSIDASTIAMGGTGDVTVTAGLDSMQKFDVTKLSVATSSDSSSDDVNAKIFELDGKKFLLADSTFSTSQTQALDSDVNVISVSSGTPASLTNTDAQKIAANVTKATGLDTTTYSAGGPSGSNISATDVVFTKDTLKLSGNSLTLQIGDTSDSYNQLEVKIQDMHTSSLGIDDIDIGTQDGATSAVDKIKTAINTVSSVRGTLGATQNRLEHTINNLSVMTENTQDAESTIRDTDVASEMMAYTKNNILVQSAQAMLAQANQVPQGVLQLLQ